ncbi:uncharacterized protein LOC122500335 isoform X1 [Leptopilina heterotoma]|uniref:uncharacterized protein LOC122500335 isoform X1 n=1 Tax=Leptopilina heterotoma TaxID=63436 RepID=UPI001CA88A9E|nr:uncharacterized protein LOC122500335 isoform X1 [Leptopilina heterotoma]XP_043465155.1 uncharacterized protein LOC122500335 isoform X1 [Leptopilina heterotoma]
MNVATPNHVQKLVEALHDASKLMETNVKYEDVAVCLGSTGSGKSTLINALIGNRLKAERNGRCNTIEISLADDQASGPQMGIASTVSSSWMSNTFPSMSIWDTPGFDDARSASLDAINASYIFHLIRKVKPLKIILVVDIIDILNDNVKPFLSVLNELENLLGDQMKSMFSSISVVFSKVPDFINDIPVNIEFITDTLKEKFLTTEDLLLTPLTKYFLLYLTENVDRVALFKRVEPGENIFVATDNIRQVINNSTSLNNDALKKLKICIPNSSKIFLFNARSSVLISKAEFMELRNILRSVYESKNDVLKDIINKKANECEIQTYLNDLKLIGKQISIIIQENNLTLKIEFLKSIDVSIRNKIEEHRLTERTPLIKFSDKLLEMNELDELSLKLHSILCYVSSKVKKAILFYNFILGTIPDKEYFVLKNEEHKEYKKRLYDCKKELQKVISKNNERKVFFENLGTKKIVLFSESELDELLKKQNENWKNEIEEFERRVHQINEELQSVVVEPKFNDKASMAQPRSKALQSESSTRDDPTVFWTLFIIKLIAIVFFCWYNWDKIVQFFYLFKKLVNKPVRVRQ